MYLITFFYHMDDEGICSIDEGCDIEAVSESLDKALLYTTSKMIDFKFIKPEDLMIIKRDDVTCVHNSINMTGYVIQPIKVV